MRRPASGFPIKIRLGENSFGHPPGTRQATKRGNEEGILPWRKETMPTYHFERVLFVVGQPGSGKSKQLRSIFRDARLGTNGAIPTATTLDEIYRLSNERCLYFRLTSPHETGETINITKGRRNSP